MRRWAATQTAAFLVAGVMMHILKRLLDPRELQENRNLFVSLVFLNQHTVSAKVSIDEQPKQSCGTCGVGAGPSAPGSIPK